MVNGGHRNWTLTKSLSKLELEKQEALSISFLK
jgi:hypothetical protein